MFTLYFFDGLNELKRFYSACILIPFLVLVPVDISCLTHTEINVLCICRTVNTQIKPCLDKLKVDSDIDVCHFAYEAIDGKYTY